MRLEDALRFNGYTISPVTIDAATIETASGPITIPAMLGSGLTWQRTGDPLPVDSFYLTGLPIFDPAYQPVILSQILDRFSTRRLAYDMPGMFGLAVQRWGNRELGPMSVFNRLYVSTATDLPLTTQDAATDRTSSSLSRDAHSDFPQGQLSGNLDYATDATDQAASVTDNTSYQGRLGVSIMELLAKQRDAFLNVDTLVLDSLESLFLGVFDQDDSDPLTGPPSVYGNGYDVFGFGSYAG